MENRALNDHEAYMRLALALAREAAADGEVPVGAVIVRNGGNRHRPQPPREGTQCPGAR